MPSSERVGREAALRGAALAGDASAWHTLYESACAELWSCVLWRCAGMRELAEEVTQETWLVAVRRLGDFNPARGSFLAWLRGIAARVLSNHLRKLRRRPEPLTGSETAPDRQHECEVAELIALALADLSDRQEAVLRAKYLDRAGVEEIAAQWDESPKAIESLLTRARQAFRTAYEKHAGVDQRVKEAKP